MNNYKAVLFEQIGAIAFITLNKPEKLNALTYDMIIKIQEKLEHWANDSSIYAVVIKSSCPRAFCAGGDIKAMAILTQQNNYDLITEFFRAEYHLNLTIAQYPKPYIALIDNIVFGGGAGISLHGSHPIVTQNTTFAMPETAIGYFPDIGATFFLNKVGNYGLYLGLIGARINGADLLALGLVKDYIPSHLLDEFIARLIATNNIEQAIKSTSVQMPPPSELVEQKQIIDRLFSAATIDEFMVRLQNDSSSLAKEIIKKISLFSPHSLKVTWQQLRGGTGLGIAAALQCELKLGINMVKYPDFYEGIRAILIDRDNKPKWQPADLCDVTPEMVNAMFTDPIAC